MQTQPENAQMLLEAFASFSQVSDSLERAYTELQDRVNLLSHQLEETNYYLSSVLQNLPCGVMVIDHLECVTSMNAMGARMLGLEAENLPCALDSLLQGHPEAARLLEAFRCRQSATELELGQENSRTLALRWSAMRHQERVFVIQDLTELRLLEREVQQAETLSAMGEMAVEVAHEIRNPLGGLELFASLLREPDLSEEDRRRYVDNVQIGVRSLNTVVSNMLCFSREPSPVFVSTDLSELLQEIVRFMAPLLRQREIAVEETCSAGPAILVDPDMMRQVFTNLISNALQALSAGGILSLQTTSTEEEAVIRIRDNGIGIPEEYQKRIFDPRFTTNQNGNGLGLAIVDRLIKSHRGTIALESREGWGTEFTITLPTGRK